MGSYVAATVLGGMLGRLLGGFSVPAWRLAFVGAALFALVTAIIAARMLPHVAATTGGAHREVRYRSLLARADLWLMFACAAAGQAIFSPVFNTVPYRLAEAPMALPTAQTTAVYLVYLVGVVVGPASGRFSNRFGNGNTLLFGALLLAASLLLLLVPAVSAVVIALLGVCCGFFAVHAAAVGALNRRLEHGQGRANALYVLFYYLGAGFGVSWSSWVYQHLGWAAMIAGALMLTAIPGAVGWLERRRVFRSG